MSIKRVITAVIGLPIVIAVLVLSNKYIIDLLLTAVGIIAMREYIKSAANNSDNMETVSRKYNNAKRDRSNRCKRKFLRNRKRSRGFLFRKPRQPFFLREGLRNMRFRRLQCKVRLSAGFLRYRELKQSEGLLRPFPG